MLVSTAAFAAAFFIYLLSYEGILHWLYYSEQSEKYWNRKWDAVVEALQEHVTENEISTRELIRDFGQEANYQNVSLYFEKYDLENAEYRENYNPEDYGGRIINCRDGNIYVYVYPSGYYENVGKVIAMGCAAVGFFSVLIPFFLHIIHRILQLSGEMEILAGGELSYRIVSVGRDELSELGQSIEGMRCSVLEQMERENRAVLANSRLITSLSHDLRTPLTKLMGYLEIMKYEKYKNEAERELYLQKAIDKACQMQVLSDEMFRHFQVRQSADGVPEWEVVSGPVLLSQLLSDECYDLEKEGFETRLPAIGGSYQLLVKVEDVRRIFDNIFSNLRKYADFRQPILFEVEEAEEEAVIIIKNHIRTQKANDSCGIGIPTIRSLLSSNNGRLETQAQGKVFCMKVCFRMVKS